MARKKRSFQVDQQGDAVGHPGPICQRLNSEQQVEY
jgi:hypothetical protein